MAGAKISSDLDARYASGDLTAADLPRYDTAHRESVAGVVCVAAAAAVGVLAVVLWQ
ncbi:MAG: hypothetical protein JST92_05020 [Deltaproteobacteria bacterium]|nr:hypothetical protein [Deltaproteobacteria bacterium]